MKRIAPLAVFLMLAVAASGREDSFVKEINEVVPGTFSGRLQLLAMGRDFDPGGDVNSGSLALTINYRSPQFGPVTVGLQGIHAAELFEGGSLDNPRGSAWVLSNSAYSLLNEAYIDISLEPLGLAGSSLRIGRQILKLDFAPAYAIRHKAQSFEAAVLTVKDVDNLSVTLGHIERFSSWTSRDTAGYIHPRYDFVEIADTERGNGVDYNTDGIQFGSVTWSGIPRTSITVYDFYAQDLYNTFGAKASHTLELGGDVSAALKCHYLGQRDVGKYESETGNAVDADLFEASVQFKRGGLSIEPGIMTVAGNDAENDVHTPFRTSFTADPTLLWYPRVFSAGSDSIFIKSLYTWRKTTFYAMAVRTEHDDNVGNGATDQEIDVVIKQEFPHGLYAAVKLGYGEQDNDGVPDADATDYRLFVGWNF